MLPYTIDDYDITREGNVINKHSGRILKGQPNSKGYLRVSIGGHLEFIHRLVAEKFIPNPDNKEQVNHINGIKTDNRVENLEWITNQENRNHAVKNDLQVQGERCPWAKLTEKDVIFIRKNCDKYSNVELAEMFNVCTTTIYDVKNYRSWKKVKI